MDLSKSYDCLNYDYLLVKLRKYWIRGNVLEWFKSRDVLQGGVTGPILLIIFMNNFIDILNDNANHNCHFTYYADDTNLLISDTKFPELIKSRNLSYRVEGLFSKNNLLLHIEKQIYYYFLLSNKECIHEKKINS